MSINLIGFTFLSFMGLYNFLGVGTSFRVFFPRLRKSSRLSLKSLTLAGIYYIGSVR